MAQPLSGGIGKCLKRYLITGLLVWLPITVTIWIIDYIIDTTDKLITLIPAQWQPEKYIGFHIPGLGFVIAVLALFITGVFAANVLGRKILEAWDSLLGRIPVVKSIYSSVKKVSESLLSDNSRSFKTPVLVPFPQPNIWTIAFVSRIEWLSTRKRQLHSRICTDHAKPNGRLLHHGAQIRYS